VHGEGGQSLGTRRSGILADATRFVVLDLVFAPDGIERFEDAWSRRVEVEEFPVCHLDDIIASKEATGRVKDRESLPRLRAFRTYWLGRP
jgi:hypothetical protein